MPIPDDFQQFLLQERIANERFLAGDAGPAKMQWSHADDVTICGGFGAYEKGWEQVGSRLDWAAAAYREGHSAIEMLAMGTSGDLAYAVWIDRGQVRLVGREGLSPTALRITQIYRREEGTWKVIHRHGDPITEKTEVEAIISHPSITPEERFAMIVEELRSHPDIIPPIERPQSKKKFGSSALKVKNKIFVMLVEGKLVVKLPKHRIDALVASGAGERFDPRRDGRLLKEWVTVEPMSEEGWLDLAREAMEFVASQQ